MVASVNFGYFLQIRIMRERESRRQRCLLMKHIILRRRQKQKLFITLCSALISLCRKQKVKRIGEWDDVSEIVNGFKRFETLTAMSVSNHISEYQEKFHFKSNRASLNSWYNSWRTCLASREIRDMFIQTKSRWLLSHNCRNDRAWIDNCTVHYSRSL